jgi:hypothetical protein
MKHSSVQQQLPRHGIDLVWKPTKNNVDVRGAQALKPAITAEH